MITKPELLYGGAYNPEQWPETVWPEDMALMKRAGVNMVTLGVFSWAKLQPNPDTYTFGWLDRVMALLAQNEIFVNLATATASPPPWLATLHPESLPINAAGQRLFPACQHYCPNSVAYREFAARLVREIATHFRGHPALVMWHINHEFGAHVGECYCETCTAVFRRWLRRRYGTLDGLNEHWGTAFWSQWYYDWEEIQPPRLAPACVNPAQQLDYLRFMNDSLLGCFLAEKQILSEITPELPVTTNFAGPHGLLKPVNYFEWARHVDVVAFDASADPLGADPADLAFACDLQRCLRGGQPWLLMEQAPSQGNWQPHNAVKRPGQMRLWSYQALAHGADGILFFQWRAAQAGAQKFHSGMVPHSGPESRTFAEVEQLGGDLKKLALLRGSRTTAEIALIIDWENMWALELESRPAQVNYSELVRSYYRALFEPGVAIDIITPESDLAGYKLVIAPALYLVRDDTARHFEAFVDNGGTLVMTFFSGMVDASDRVFLGGYPAPFRKLLGIHVEEFDAFGAQLRHIKTPMRGARCTLWADVIQLEGAEAVATFTEDFYAQRPAITRNAVGRGLAYYIGTQPESAFLRTFLGELSTHCGVRPPMRVPAGVEVTTRSSEHGEFLFLLNHSTTVQFVDVGTRIRRDLLSGEMIKGQCQLGPYDARVLQRA